MKLILPCMACMLAMVATIERARSLHERVGQQVLSRMICAPLGSGWECRWKYEDVRFFRGQAGTQEGAVLSLIEESWEEIRAGRER